MNIIEILDGIPGLIAGKAAEEESILNAADTLQLNFADEYKAYLRKYGTAMFGGHEFSGISIAIHRDVVRLTLRERDLNDAFPLNIYVVENTGMDGMIICQNSDGQICLWDGIECRPYRNSLAEYIERDLLGMASE